MDALLLDGLADADIIPGRRLQQHMAGRLADLGVAAADDAAQAQCASGIRHQDALPAQLALDIVQGQQLFVRLGQARDDGGLAARPLDQLVIIKGVQGLPQFKGQVVGHIDDIVARTLADELEAMPQPERRRLDHSIAQQGEREARVQLWLADIDSHLPGDWRALRQEIEGWVAHLHIQQRRHLPRDADHAEAARQVGGELDIQDDIAKRISQRRASHISLIVIHEDDAFVLVGDAQFLLRTDHALVVDAAQFPAFEGHALGRVAVAIPDRRPFQRQRAPKRRIDLALVFVSEEVARAGHALLQLVAAIIDHGQHQPVGAGMRLDLDDAPQRQLVALPDQMIRRRHLQARNLCLGQADVLDMRHFQASHGQALSQQLDRDIDIDIIS